jgi:hypothetical protein
MTGPQCVAVVTLRHRVATLDLLTQQHHYKLYVIKKVNHAFECVHFGFNVLIVAV